jgi:hypothetical protein
MHAVIKELREKYEIEYKDMYFALDDWSGHVTKVALESI